MRVVFVSDDPAAFAETAEGIRSKGYQVLSTTSNERDSAASWFGENQDAVVLFLPVTASKSALLTTCRDWSRVHGTPLFVVGLDSDESPGARAEDIKARFDEIIRLPATSEDVAGVISRFEDRLQPFREVEPPAEAREAGPEAIKEFYERVIDTISDGIRVIDGEERRIVLANRAHLEWIGRTAGEVIGARARDIPWGMDLGGQPVQMTDLVDEALATGAPARRLIATRPGTGGSLRWIDVVAYPTFDAPGPVEHLVLVGRDVTDRVKMEASLAAERDRRDLVFRSAPVGILTTDAQGRIEFSNPSVVQILGLGGAESVVGTNLLELPQLQAADVTARLREALEQGSAVHLDRVRCCSPEHVDRVFNLRADPILAETGGISGIVAVFEDVTETVQLQRRLSVTTADLAMLSEIGELFQDSRDNELILQAILVGVTAGEGLGFNRAFLLTADWETKTLRGTHAIGPSDPSEASRVWHKLGTTPHTFRDLLNGYREAISRDEVAVTKVAQTIEIPLDGADNMISGAATERKAFLVNDVSANPRVPRALAEQLGTESFVVAPLVFDDRVEGVIIADNAITHKEITDLDVRGLELFAHQARLAVERSRLQGELERQLKELREAHALLQANHREMLRTEKLAAMGQVAAQVAHEIKNPLVAIGGFARSIRNSLTEDDQTRRFSEIIVEETARLENILREVLDFARPLEPHRGAIDLNEVLRRALETLDAEIQERNVRKNVELPEYPVWVNGDADQFRQVFHNLVQNAMDAMDSNKAGLPHNERLLRVSLTVDNQGRAEARIEDNGGGLEKEAFGHVFDPFFTTKPHGTGLGLAICQQIVQNHNGTLSVTNRPGSGAIFCVSLPLLEKEAPNGENPGC